MPFTFSFESSVVARSRLALNASDFGATLSMRGLRFQGLVNIVPLPACFLVVDLHVKRQRELAAGENRVEVARKNFENVFASRFPRCEIATLAEPQHHREKAELRIAVRDRVMLA